MKLNKFLILISLLPMTAMAVLTNPPPPATSLGPNAGIGTPNPSAIYYNGPGDTIPLKNTGTMNSSQTLNNGIMNNASSAAVNNTISNTQGGASTTLKANTNTSAGGVNNCGGVSGCPTSSPNYNKGMVNPNNQ